MSMPMKLLLACFAVSVLLDPTANGLRLKRPPGEESHSFQEAANSLSEMLLQEARHALRQKPKLGPTEEEREASRIVLHHELYHVDVNLELESFDTEKGVSMVFAKETGAMRLDSGFSPTDAFAWGHFIDSLEHLGWSQLSMSISESHNVPNNDKIYAAGYAEGLMTCVRISEFYANNFKLLLRKGKVIRMIKDVVTKKLAYWRDMTNLRQHIMAEEPKDPYWKQVRYVLVQLWGICDGYNFAARHFQVHSLGLEDLLLINLGGELAQLVEAYGGEQAGASLLQLDMFRHKRRRHAIKDSNMTSTSSPRREPKGSFENSSSAAEDPLDDSHWEHRVAESGRCTAFIRLAESNADLLMGHTTWDDYSRMTRIFKYYHFNFLGADTVAKYIGFSSYPGAVSSTDDFFITDSGLGVMDTSIEVLDATLWGRMPRAPGLPTFAHLMAVNRLAKSAAHWSEMFTRTPESTYYAAQWMVLDYNKFKAGEPPPPQTLWVTEVLPGMSHMEDKTEMLIAQGYWGSYNRPYFENIRELSGHAAAEKKAGSLYSYDKNPRATIFKKSGPEINSLFDMRGLMSRNMWPNSGVSPNGPGHEISARMDMSGTTPFPNGGIDAKVTNSCLRRSLQVQAESGPSHGFLGPFAWKGPNGRELWPGWPHVGLPNIWNFNFVQLSASGAGVLEEANTC